MSFTGKQTILQAQEVFGRTLIEKSEVSGNVLISPISLHGILSILQGCTEEKARKALSLVLHLTYSQSYTEEYDKVLTQISNLTNIRLSNEFKLTTPLECTLKPSVVDMFRKFNITVERGTQDKLIVVSSIRFQSVLGKDFEVKSNDTMLSKRGFKVCRDQEVQVDMVSSLNTYKYKTDDHLDAKIIEIPLINKDVNLLLIVPNDPYGVHQLQAELADFDLEELTDHLQNAFLDVSLPKIKLDISRNIGDAFEQIILVDIFDQNGGVNSHPIDEVISKVYLEIGQGSQTEEVKPTANNRGGCFCRVITDQIYVDHPFIIYIIAKDELPYVILQGKIVNPLETV